MSAERKMPREGTATEFYKRLKELIEKSLTNIENRRYMEEVIEVLPDRVRLGSGGFILLCGLNSYDVTENEGRLAN